MTLKTAAGESVEVDDAAIMSAAAKIRVSRRRVHRGGRPAKARSCARCGSEHLGLKMLTAHMAMCGAGPVEPVDEEYLKSIAWEPEGAP